jgi:cytochrome P450
MARTEALSGSARPLPAELPFVEIFDARNDPLAFLERTSRRYGDVFSYRLEGWAVVVVNDPALAREALQADGEALTKEGTPDLMMLRPMLGQGLMTNEGRAWSLSRSASQPAFTADKVRGYRPRMLALVDAMLDGWADTAAPTLDLEREFNRLTLRVVGDCLFSTDLSPEMSDLGRSVETMNRCVAHFDPADHAMHRRFVQAHADMHALIQSIVDTGGGTDDLLAALRRRCAANPTGDPAHMLRDEIVTFLMAGHETTAKALSWAMHLLAQHPEVEAAVRAEARKAFAAGAGTGTACDTVDRLAYTWQVVQEAMRLYPPVWLMSRRTRCDMVLGDFTLPEGALLLVSPYLLHRHPAHWQAPLDFDPARFSPTAASRSAGAYMPFGAGHRVCIGRLFAAAETTLALARVVERFECRHSGSATVEAEALVTLRPRGGLPMRVRPWP